ncbi:MULTISPECIES: LysE family translocator [unclassified Vibrio]|uniref:LysE family translocator n=1 Tax=Vibrio sp. HB236076 TaxID=3232307 RepID=A0AB39HIH5_9VIBR|nr:LysE family translocator [Vibrio sp. HB161653]MDP5254686.1 LysE family translocator [Vibrio sp. HB161653]
MDTQIFIAFLIFAVSMTITPGAGNLTLLSIANRYGFVAALPFVAGTSLGVLVVFVGASAGLYNLMSHYPQVFEILKYLGAVYLLYTAWSIARLKIDNEQPEQAAQGLLAGALIQILNPKAWIAAMTVFAQFIQISDHYVMQVTLIITVFITITALCTSLWAYFGSALKSIIASQQQAALLNRGLALCLAATVIYMLCQPQ